MLIEDIKAPMTAEMLSEIVESQICCFGDAPLITRPKFDFINGVEILIENSILLCCMSDEEMSEDNLTLMHLAKYIKAFDERSILYYISLKPKVFSVGFYADDRFIEVVNSSELAFR
ncbi:hypothetical protein [Pseudoalteromonas sp. TAB23]|uniref:hypothetical protein n=1 Tax=Pseudoalteromonas sp. TAB23 TaxID=1938595 RepID=UPI000414BDB2|nr:hypothetical protein [Pseudoalteromonas sp. TAB23]